MAVAVGLCLTSSCEAPAPGEDLLACPTAELLGTLVGSAPGDAPAARLASTADGRFRVALPPGRYVITGSEQAYAPGRVRHVHGGHDPTGTFCERAGGLPYADRVT